MVRDRVAHRLGRHLGDHHAEAVEVGVDHAGRAARTRGRRRDACATGGWHGRGRGWRCGRAGGTRPSCTARWWRRPRAWCWCRARRRSLGTPAALSNGASSGKPGASAGACDATIGVPSASSTSPTAFTTTSAPTTTSPSRADAVPIPPVRAVLAAAPLGDARAPPGADPSGRERRRRGSKAAASAARPSSAPGAFVARDHEVEDRGGGHDRHRTATRREPPALLGERAHTPSAVASPNAEPPVSTIASTCSTRGERIEHRGLARRRRAAADLDRARPCRAGTPRRSRRWPRRSSARRAHRGRR